MKPWHAYVEGIGLWSAHWPDFAALRTQVRGGNIEASATRPPANRLPANERRRAPESVLLAVEVAGQAVDMSAADPAQLVCVFASAHGDHVITDYMCTTLARAPTELSPTRFHNSVHNAPAGYWTIVSACHAPTTAICAGAASFAHALLEATMQAMADRRKVLLVCSDIAGTGPLNELTDCRQSFGTALLLAPAASERSLARLDLYVTAGEMPAASASPASPCKWYTDNASANSLPLLAALAGSGGKVALALTPSMYLDVHTEIIP
ncbi:MAG TPA: beta-ketoacyl synthase chain length factor [Dyella sp.]|uniref:beta-ketoacyl synthase chain length factor n=1 Tax=Dyella sp. TaxID=1869338 RepID=UPI002F9582A7